MKSVFALALAAVVAGQAAPPAEAPPAAGPVAEVPVAAVGQPIPPAEFGLPMAENNTQLGVAFFPNNQSVIVQPGILFGKSITSAQPSIAIDTRNSSTINKVANDGSRFLLVMIDPDAPTPNAPTASAILHWMATDLEAITAPQDFGPLRAQSVLMTMTPNPVPYAPPGPPPTSSAHRYLLFLFAQPANFAVPAAFAQFSATNRAKFDLNAFVSAAGLAAPLAVNFMYVSSQPAVLPDFQGPPGGQFPGGNGDAIGLAGSTAAAPAVPAGGAGAGAAPAAPAEGAGAGAGAAPQAENGTTGATPASGLIAGTPGEVSMGTGVFNAADGSCTCNVACPAGSLARVVVT